MEQISGYNVLREVNRTALLNEKKKRKLILFGPHPARIIPLKEASINLLGKCNFCYFF